MFKQKSNICLSFNTQPPEGGWNQRRAVLSALKVSTHSRPKAAGLNYDARIYNGKVSTHSRPKAAGKANIGC